MILSFAQIQEKLKEGKVNPEIEWCVKHDRHSTFHTEPTQNHGQIPYLDEYLRWVGTIIDTKKLEVFTSLLTLPVETVDFLQGIRKEVKKLFDGQNRSISYNFKNKELSDDYDQYLTQVKDDAFWKGDAFSAMWSGINSILIVDMPSLEEDENGNLIQPSKFPEPYYYLLDIKYVFDFELDDNNEFVWIIFQCPHEGQEKYYCFDKESFSSFDWIKDSENSHIENEIVVDHDLTYTPAKSFWSTPFNKESRIQKRSPISPSLGKIDFLLFLYTSSRHVTLYSGFPIYLMFEQRCNYKDDDGNSCENGRIPYSMKMGVSGQEYSETKYKDCPTCKNKKLLGAGTVLTAPAMTSKDDPSLLHGVEVVSADKDSLDSLKSELIYQENKLIWNICGGAEEKTKEAMNELQVASGYESRLNVLLDLKDNFEKANKFILDTVAKLRYGTEFISSNVFYGNIFYLYNIDDLVKSYNDAKTGGVPYYELANQLDQIIQTKYKNNPDQIVRARILKVIEPWPHNTLADLVTMQKLTPLSRESLMLKFGFDDYVARFEMEYTNIVSFMPLATQELKVLFIKEKLLSYVHEDMIQIDEQVAKEQEAAAKAAAIENPPALN